MTAGFNAALHLGDTHAVVSLSGELDLAEAPGLRRTLTRVLESHPSLVVIDARELHFLDSTGIGVLVAARNEQDAAGRLFVIANLSESVGRPIRLTGVDTAIPVHWAGQPVQPWLDADADPASILSALGLSATALAGDASVEPIG
jgi:anti-anti-sigma factor